MKEGLIDIHICYRDRPSELGFLLLSLRNQTYKNFRIFISDDCSGTPIQNYHFLMCIFNKLNEEGKYINYSRNEFNLGVSKNRQKLVDLSLQYDDAEFILRLDDDIILEPDYIEKLLKVINQGYDLASGITPFIGQPQFKRESKFLKGIGNRIIFNNKGEFIYNGDSCGMLYLDEVILPLDHFRSCALYKLNIHKQEINYNSKLTKHGFREEQILSFKMILKGFKLGFHTGAIAWHLLTPSGGERFEDSNELIKINQQILEEWTKLKYELHGDFIKEYHKKFDIKELEQEEYYKQENLIRI